MTKIWYEGYVKQARRMEGLVRDGIGKEDLLDLLRDDERRLEAELDDLVGDEWQFKDGELFSIQSEISILTTHGEELGEWMDELVPYVETIEAAIERNLTLRDVYGEPEYSNSLVRDAVMGISW